MATRFDRMIQELEQIVEARLGRCSAVSAGVRCLLPQNHQPPEKHRFTADSTALAERALRNGDARVEHKHAEALPRQPMPSKRAASGA